MAITESKAEFRRLRLRQLDESLRTARNIVAHLGIPRKGWIREIRETLGMTAEQLGRRMKVRQSSVATLEIREREGRITLNSLKRAADALDCEVVYFLVPRESLEQTLRSQISKFIGPRFSNVAYSMALEEQAVSKEHLQRRIDEAVEELMRRPPRDLWA